ncbi:SDR family NAD(P)-dependent oxidoreductase [Neisseria sp. 83E34]|uniref:SDR family NAD(P)-dependent oxidoreductase n=1 Tax=Neisseria sp. 83E34 TaxID=1692264 RepID=UPI0006CEA607|nr:SDR family NAD(P)-dependent oxidoreductase [Neisseria sp. 83E34]KPN71039.1 short-chain dehydrogenase [Neisseria sp. 83E34]
MEKVIITGHSRGLGKALTQYYLDKNCTVFGLSRNLLKECLSENLQQQAIDLSDSQALNIWLEQGVLAHFISSTKHIVLINNAGTTSPNAILCKQNAADIMQAVALNITAPLLLANHLASHKPTDACLKIIHISSGAGRNAYPGWSVYGATKAALDHHAQCVNIEANPNIRALSIAPGVVDTDMQAAIRASDADHFPMLQRFLDLKKQGGLSSSKETAAKIAGIIEDERFELEAICDVRQYS